MGERDTVEILRHARHDWMNQIQLIKGYLSLGKIEKVQEIINQIIKSSENESRISNIRMPQLATLLLTYNWEPTKIVLKFEVEGSGHYNDDETNLVNWFKEFLHILEESATIVDEHELHIRIILDDSSIRFNIQYKGILNEEKAVLAFIKESSYANNILNLDIGKGYLHFDLISES